MATFTQRGDSWTAQIRIAGHPSVTKTFKKKAHAEQWAKRTESQMRDGAFSDERKLTNFTIGGLVGRYIEEVGEVKPFGKSKRGALEMLRRSALGAVPAAKISPAAIIEYARERHRPRPDPKKPGEMIPGAGPVTIGVELAYLSTVLKIARALWQLPLSTQVIDDARETLRHLGLVGKSRERDRRPSPAELLKLRTHFAENRNGQRQLPMVDIIDFAIATTMRASEITGIRWEDLNEHDRTVIIRNRKHPQEKIGNDQVVPLLGAAFDIVMRQSRTADGRIFPYRSATISSIFPRACAELGIEDLHFHDLRHEGISRLFEQGYRIEQVALVSGHRDWKMLKRYTQVRAKDLHRPPEPKTPALTIAA